MNVMYYILFEFMIKMYLLNIYLFIFYKYPWILKNYAGTHLTNTRRIWIRICNKYLSNELNILTLPLSLTSLIKILITRFLLTIPIIRTWHKFVKSWEIIQHRRIWHKWFKGTPENRIKKQKNKKKHYVQTPINTVESLVLTDISYTRYFFQSNGVKN